MYDKIYRLYIQRKIEAHRRCEKLEFLSMSVADFIELQKHHEHLVLYKPDRIVRPKFNGLRILRTEDLEPGEFIFH